MTTKLVDEWTARVRGAVHLADPADAEKIALRCIIARGLGLNFVVWHQAAEFYGTKCHCVPCSRLATVAGAGG